LGFNCADELSASERILSTDFLSRYYIKTKTCTLANPNLMDYFQRTNVHYVIVDKEFPEVVSYFENASGYAKVKEERAYALFEVAPAPKYVRTNENISFTYSKQPDRIIINLHSDEKYTDVDVNISETWYPHWASDDATMIRQNLNGLMSFTVPEIDGDKQIVLTFSYPGFYKYLPWIAILWLCVLAVNSKKELFGIERL